MYNNTDRGKEVSVLPPGGYPGPFIFFNGRRLLPTHP